MGAKAIALSLLVLVPSVQVQTRPRPPWAGQVGAFGELERTLKQSDLAQKPWTRELMVCPGEKDGVWVFDPKTGNLTLYSSRGQLHDALVVRSWQPRASDPPWSGLACVAKGGTFLFWNKNELVSFSGDGITREVKIPAMAIRDALPRGDEALVATVPAVFRTGPEARGFVLAEAVIWRVNEKGEVTGRWLAPEPIAGMEPFAQALANQVLLAAGKDRVFAAAQHGRYRVWSFGLEGRELWRFEDQHVGLGPKEITKKGAAPPPDLTEEGKKAFRPLNVPFTVRALTATRDWVWVLFDPGVFEGQLILDVLPSAGEKPVARFKLNAPKDVVPRALVVTSDAVWVFPTGDGCPLAFFRPPDEVLTASTLPSQP